MTLFGIKITANKKFQSTLPRREWQGGKARCGQFVAISIHTPTKGVTYGASGREIIKKISIHTPTKGVTVPGALLRHGFRISIHTPTKGVTITGDYFCMILRNFNPHSHEGSDIDALTGLTDMLEFQSTLPRREWPVGIHCPAGTVTISIHTPTKGVTK